MHDRAFMPKDLTVKPLAIDAVAGRRPLPTLRRIRPYSDCRPESWHHSSEQRVLSGGFALNLDGHY